MSSHSIPLILGTACVLLLSVSAENPVHIHHSDGMTQLLTSSTLAWIPHTFYHDTKVPRDIVIGGFDITERSVNTSVNDSPKITKESPIFVCRAQHEGTWVAGSQKQGDRKCTVGFVGSSVRSYERYDLLENVESAGRLSWTTWNKFVLPPDGMVAVRDDKLYVARHSIPKTQSDDQEVKYNSHCIGTLTFEEGFGKITCAQESRLLKTYDSGEILVETEPVRYELTRLKLNHNKRRVLSTEERILGEATIKNTGPRTAKMAEAFGYSYSYSMYWGQVRAMSKGLDTTITLPDGKVRNIKWGTKDKGNETSVYTVNVTLEPGTAVNVTLKGNYTNMEVFYTGDLIPHYEDKTRRIRSISGFLREENMMNVHPEYSPIYFLSNFSVVPTTEPPPPTTSTLATTTTTVLTTTSTTTKRAPQPPILMSGVDEKVSKDEEVDENMIMPKKTELGVQGGDGGPLSLKDRSEAGRSAAGPRFPALTLLLVFALSVNRVT